MVKCFCVRILRVNKLIGLISFCRIFFSRRGLLISIKLQHRRFLLLFFSRSDGDVSVTLLRIQVCYTERSWRSLFFMLLVDLPFVLSENIFLKNSKAFKNEHGCL